MAHGRKTFPRDRLVCLVAGAVILAARASFADHYRVPTGSMEPTVAVGDQVCVDKLAYGLRIPASDVYLVRAAGPQRGDVVVLTSPASGDVLLKRVVAIPGDTVSVVDGRLAIDGAPVPTSAEGGEVIETLGQHRHRLGMRFGGGPDLPATRVPDKSYLVMGDNRGNSLDGRSFGWVVGSAILGRAAAVCLHGGRPVWDRL
jgi:signal peptidase I